MFANLPNLAMLDRHFLHPLISRDERVDNFAIVSIHGDGDWGTGEF
jgi:hypothetical protein